MRIEHSGIVTSIHKHSTDMWCVEIKRTETGTKGITTYVGIKVKPRLKVGQRVKAGDEI